jgi:signal transduction histidine kinase
MLANLIPGGLAPAGSSPAPPIECAPLPATPIEIPAEFPPNAAALNEALLIRGLREHELRDAAEKLSAQLQIEIVERVRAEQALQEAKAKLRADADLLEHTVAERTAQLRVSVSELEAFAYSIAHDLRAPVRAIHSFTQLALELPATEVGPAATTLLNRVTIAAARMDSLIQDVLSLSQVIRRPIKIESVEVEALVRALVEERPELSPPRAKITIKGPLRRMLGHEATLSQCVTNLLTNAVKFVEPGAVPQVRVRSENLGSRIRLWVEDQGIGIAPEARDTIFEMFQRLHTTAQYEGSGIGLAIVYKGMQRMGGRVGFESEPGAGSRFWLELPKG